jgi:hypothetical protein
VGKNTDSKNTSKPKRNPFSINITVSDDAIKIDSTHPEIGSKTVSVDRNEEN